MNNAVIIRCTINSKIGEINEKKKNILAEKFSEKFPYKGCAPGNTSLLLKNDTTNVSISISNSDIVYSIRNSNVQIDEIKEMQNDIDEIFNIFLLDDDISARFNIVFYENSINKDTISKSKEFLKNSIFSNVLDNVEGAGIKFYINYKDSLSEIRIEPFLTDLEKFYIESSIMCENLVYKNISSELLEAYDIVKGISEKILLSVNNK